LNYFLFYFLIGEIPFVKFQKNERGKKSQTILLANRRAGGPLTANGQGERHGWWLWRRCGSRKKNKEKVEKF